MDKMMLLPCVFFFVFSIQVSSALDVCGLEAVPKCAPVDTSCLENLEMSLLSWYQTPEAAGFLLKPIDPLIIGELDFTAGSKKITLNNVTITGLADSLVEADLTLVPAVIHVTFTHNAEVKANDYTVKDLCTGVVNQSEKPFFAKLSDVTTDGDVAVAPVLRCDGTTHLSLKQIDLTSNGGDALVMEGPKEAQTDSDDFESGITTIIGRIATEEMFKRKVQFLSEVLLSDVVTI